MISSPHLTDPKTGELFQIHVDDHTLSKIATKVRQNEKAMAALLEGYDIVQEALERGDISSPRPPKSYITIYNIMNQFDERYAGTLGPKVIAHLQQEILQTEG